MLLTELMIATYERPRRDSKRLLSACSSIFIGLYALVGPSFGSGGVVQKGVLYKSMHIYAMCFHKRVWPVEQITSKDTNMPICKFPQKTADRSIDANS